MVKYYFLAFLTFIILTGCNKEKQGSGTGNSIDSIPLKYTLEPPNTTSVDIDGDGYNDIRITDSVWFYYIDPYKYIRYNLTTIKSLTLKLQISPGKLIMFDRGVLRKDSVINASLAWFDNYIYNGDDGGPPQGYWSEYVGLKKVENSHTYYGWLHIPGYHGGSSDYAITEFAIDTSNVVRKVLAGRKKK